MTKDKSFDFTVLLLMLKFLCWIKQQDLDFFILNKKFEQR